MLQWAKTYLVLEDQVLYLQRYVQGKARWGRLIVRKHRQSWVGIQSFQCHIVRVDINFTQCRNFQNHAFAEARKRLMREFRHEWRWVSVRGSILIIAFHQLMSIACCNRKCFYIILTLRSHEASSTRESKVATKARMRRRAIFGRRRRRI